MGIYISHFASVNWCCPATLAFSLSPRHRLFLACKLVHPFSPAKLLHSLHSARCLNPLLREASCHFPHPSTRVDPWSTVRSPCHIFCFSFISFNRICKSIAKSIVIWVYQVCFPSPVPPQGHLHGETGKGGEGSWGQHGQQHCPLVEGEEAEKQFRTRLMYRDLFVLLAIEWVRVCPSVAVIALRNTLKSLRSSRLSPSWNRRGPSAMGQAKTKGCVCCLPPHLSSLKGLTILPEIWENVRIGRVHGK